MANAATIVRGPQHALLRDLLVHRRADREPEAEEERVHDSVAEAHRACDNVSGGELERAAEDDVALEARIG